MYNVITATEKPKKVESNQFITKVCEWLEPFLLLFLFWYGMLVRHRVTSPPPSPCIDMPISIVSNQRLSDAPSVVPPRALPKQTEVRD